MRYSNVITSDWLNIEFSFMYGEKKYLIELIMNDELCDGTSCSIGGHVYFVNVDEVLEKISHHHLIMLFSQNQVSRINVK
ncbi:hypothetical protein [Vibrio splendidus]|uniref:Uncharacterized protein n=1 Tax=Vibrio splendidus 12E03 TaxID=1191305 RepID=A0A1E5FB33_VIBSP|nr:hypothetical protein [Vibrio splendidus]OEF85186.1 hypothetical protein A142_12870 [Vibrio splendidus 12E03]